MKLYKYHGAGNDFLIADGRDGGVDMTVDRIVALCNRRTGFGADGVMVLGSSAESDFHMEFYNPDGSGGMMCGNGGRCLAAFAHDIGIEGRTLKKPVLGPGAVAYVFEAPDGMHEAEYLSVGGEAVVRLKMTAVEAPVWVGGGLFMNTGARHYVQAVDDLDHLDVLSEGRRIRYDGRFAPLGTNADFIEPQGNIIRVRTYEKGVEAETLACGTGIVASAIAAHIMGFAKAEDRTVHCRVRARLDELKVDFEPGGNCYGNIWLTGPAVFVGSIEPAFS